MFKRSIHLSTSEDNFFLWGLRQTGKSTLLRAVFPHARVIDLLQSDQFVRYRTEPHLLRQELLAAGPGGRGRARVVIDEVQKAPLLLDEVHWLIENTSFAGLPKAIQAASRAVPEALLFRRRRRERPRQRGVLEPGSELFGKAFENWVHHELRAYQAYRRPDWELAYWGLSSGAEVDFIENQMERAIEAKSLARITSDHLKGLRELASDFPKIGRRIVVCLEKTRRLTEDGILILPYSDFVRELWKDGLATE